MSVSSPDSSDHLMVSLVDERVAVDGLTRLAHEESADEDQVMVFPFDEEPHASADPVAGYSVPPWEPV